MVIVQLKIYWYDQRGQRHEEIEAPHDQAINAIKRQVGRMLLKLKEQKRYKMERYYVVVGVRIGSEMGYRTIIPMTVVQ